MLAILSRDFFRAVASRLTSYGHPLGRTRKGLSRLCKTARPRNIDWGETCYGRLFEHPSMHLTKCSWLGRSRQQRCEKICRLVCPFQKSWEQKLRRKRRDRLDERGGAPTPDDYPTLPLDPRFANLIEVLGPARPSKPQRAIAAWASLPAAVCR